MFKLQLVCTENAFFINIMEPNGEDKSFIALSPGHSRNWGWCHSCWHSSRCRSSPVAKTTSKWGNVKGFWQWPGSWNATVIDITFKKLPNRLHHPASKQSSRLIFMPWQPLIKKQTTYHSKSKIGNFTVLLRSNLDVLQTRLWTLKESQNSQKYAARLIAMCVTKSVTPIATAKL